MREIDRIFLTLFKDVKITLAPDNPGTEEKPNYYCYIGKNAVSKAEIIRLVKKYQDAIIELLLTEGQDEIWNIGI